MLIKKFVSLFKSKAFKIAACILLFIISALIGFSMLLGQEAGTFVIRVQSGDDNKSIAITDQGLYTESEDLKAEELRYYISFDTTKEYGTTINADSSEVGGTYVEETSTITVPSLEQFESYVNSKTEAEIKAITSYRLKASVTYATSSRTIIAAICADKEGKIVLGHKIISTGADTIDIDPIDSSYCGKDVYLLLFENEPDYPSVKAKLEIDSIDGMGDISPKYFIDEDYKTLKEITSVLGRTDYEDSLFIYTFYIVNTGKGSVGVNISMEYSNVAKMCDEIVRVMTYYNYNGEDVAHIYMKKDDPNHYPIPGDPDSFVYEEYTQITPEIFASDEQIFRGQHINLDFAKGNDFVKYSVLIWLEGTDPDSDYYGEKLYSGKIRFALNLEVGM